MDKSIRRSALRYAKEHQFKNGASLIRAYTAGAEEEKLRYKSTMRFLDIKVFISGKVSGEDYHKAYRKFANTERELESIGFKVVNPMVICNQQWSWLRCMIVCIRHLLSCHCIYQLSNWQQSRGARIENFIAKLFNKTFL
jgi:hypothetical protein